MAKVKWEDAPTELTARDVSVDIWGGTHTGRTTLALTFPGPIAYIHCAENWEGAIQKAAADKEIRMINFGAMKVPKRTMAQKEAGKAFDEVKEALYDACEWARTIIVDTDTDLYELIRLAHFGGIKPSGGRIDSNWGPLNAEWAGMVRYPTHRQGVHLVMIGKAGDEWTKPAKGMGNKTGRLERKGKKDMDYMYNIVVNTNRDSDGDLSAVINKSWYGAHALGMELDAGMMNFDTIIALVTGTDPEEWK